ncbi:aminotransferase class V-fold PLP-dependent enzyme [Bacteroidota bacterium]
MDLSYIINQLGEERENYFNAVSPPIIQSSNFAYKSVKEFRKAIDNEKSNLIYSRGNNPTVNILQKKLAALEKTEEALVFGSGIAAISAAVLSQVKAGDHIISVKNPYSWTNTLFLDYLPGYNIECSMIDGTNPDNFENAIKENTKLIYLESPNSWTFELQDFEKVTAIAKKHNIITAVDNSYSSPLVQSPADYGIDIILHSASKYIGGHSDIVAGVLCSSKKIIEKIFYNEYLNLGGGISPFNAWLMIRGLRTLPIRLEKISDTTKKIINFLENHPKVEKLLYPFSKNFPQYELVKKQVKKEMGLFSLYLKTSNINEIEKFCNSLKIFLMAVSWGGHESLIFPACVINQRKNDTRFPNNLIRMYIGLDEPESLIKDLESAFKSIN